jgi:hypothetical protein
LEAEPEHEIEAAPHGEHPIHAARRVIGDLVENDMERRRAHAGLVGDYRRIVPLEAGAEHLGHHAAKRGDDDFTQRGEPFVRTFEGRQVYN